MTSREATTQYPIHEIIRKRWSPRAFADKPVDEALLMQVFEAASWAFSSVNRQPWRYIYGHKGGVTFATLLSCLNPSNQIWVQHAPILILSIAHTIDDDGKENSSARHDLGAANATLALEAVANGLVTHPMGGFDADKTRALCHLRAGADPVAFIALGYPGDPSMLPEKLQDRETAPRSRKPLSELISNIIP
jgi:nitroreductase